MKNVTILRGGGITAAKYDDTWYVKIPVHAHCRTTDQELIHSSYLSFLISRRKHRRIGNWILTPKAIQGYANVLDYEAHHFVRSLYQASEGGMVPVNPQKHAGRYALK